LANFSVKLPDKFFELDKLQANKTESELWQARSARTKFILNLSGRRLAFADFKDATMPHSDLSDAKFQGANLVFANLQGATLDFANLQGATLDFASLQGATLYVANLQGADLKYANLQGAYLRYINLQGADLGYINLQGADLESAQLQDAVLWQAYLQGANLDNVQLQDAVLWQAYLQGANLDNANLQSTVLIETQLKGVSLTANQLASIQTKQLNWQTDYDFTPLKTESWAQQPIIKDRLEQAQQRQTDFKPPQLPPSIDAEKFATIWLDLLCKNDYITKGMLKQLGYLENYPVTKAQAQQYLDNQKQCEPYRTLLKN
jgi:uncharacterized protein YjbI with pentapeptide repeats